MERLPFRARCATVLWGVVSCWFSVACVAEPLPKETEPTKQPALQGDLLAEVNIQPGYVVQLWEVSPGNTIVFGTMNVDEVAGAPPFLAAGESPTTVVDIYKHMHAKAGRIIAAADIPEAIRAASLRSEERDRLLMESGAVEKASTLPEVEDHTPSHTLASECSPDVYGDNYGAQWFKDTMCNKLNSNIATTNVASWSGGYNWTGVYWVGFAWLAADFWYGARVDACLIKSDPSGGIWPFNEPIWICDLPIVNNVYFAPRQGNFFYGRAFGGSASIRGEGPCPRVHGCKMKTK